MSVMFILEGASMRFGLRQSFCVGVIVVAGVADVTGGREIMLMRYLRY